MHNVKIKSNILSQYKSIIIIIMVELLQKEPNGNIIVWSNCVHLIDTTSSCVIIQTSDSHSNKGETLIKWYTIVKIRRCIIIIMYRRGRS